ncbi:MAG: DUF945 domain-containing protein, partial [Deltaproteobacteria bacterium]|nr:DUF945 domain-containing protein [Deltaproteobacteria bacterium]
MSALTTLAQVKAQVLALSEHCFDDLIRVQDLTFEHLERVRIAGDLYPLETIAQRSICSRLAIPFEYLRRCPREIQAQNLNYWLTHECNDKLFFRFDGAQVRAVFTPRYRPVDNLEVLERLEQLGYGGEVQVQCRLDARFLSLSIPDSGQTFSVNGDKITPGLSIANSEVGLSSLRISAFFLRLKCTNGLIARTQIAAAYRHVSRRILEELPTVLSEVAGQLHQQRDKFRISLESRVDEPLNTINSFNRQFQLGKREQEAVIRGYHHEPGPTLFHIINAYTRAAQSPDL